MCATFAHAADTRGKAKDDIVASVNTRHTLWTGRRSLVTKGRDGWRPRQFHRASVEHYVARIDNQVGTSTWWPGLKHIRYREGSGTWSKANWRRWPCLGHVADQGGDGVSAVHAMLYLMSLNLFALWDPSHGAQRDLKDAFSDVGLWPLVLLLLVVVNLGHGPEKDECLRFSQINDLLDWLFKTFTAADCHLFQARAPDLRAEMGSKLKVGEGQSEMEAVRESLRHDSKYPKLGEKTKLCEFLGWQRALPDLLRTWHRRLFKAELLSLECDWLTGRLVKERLVVSQQVLDRAEEVSTTNPKVTTADVKLLRGCQVNAAVIVILLLEAPTHKRLVSIMARVPEAVAAWEGNARKTCKSTEENRAWFAQQFDGGYVAVLEAVAATLTTQKTLRESGFFVYEGFAGDDLEDRIVEDERMAHVMGNLALRVIAHRFRRWLYLLVGWPQRQLSSLVPRLCQPMVDDFMYDSEVFDVLSRIGSPFEPLAKVLLRSPFHLTPTVQFQAAYEETGGRSTDDTVRLASDRASLTTSMVCEEQVHFGKNSTQLKGSKRARRTEKTMAVCVGRKLCSRRFRYEEVEADQALTRKRQRLSKEAFRASVASCSVSLDGIATEESKASYYSPLPMDMGRSALDLSLLREVYEFDVMASLEDVDLNIMCDSRHPFVFRRRAIVGSSYGWQHGLFHISGTSACSLPVTIRAVDEHPEFEYVDFEEPSGVTPPPLPVLEWTCITARPTAWKPPSFWASRCPNSPLPPAVRAHVWGEELLLLVWLAHLAFLLYDTVQLAMIARIHKIHVSSGRSLFTMLYEMIAAVLQIDDEFVILDKMRQRLVGLQPEEDYDLLLDVEEAQELLTKEDQKDVVDEQKKADSKKGAFKSFANEYVQRRHEARQRRAAAGGAGGVGGGHGAAGAGAPARPQLPGNCRITHGDGARFMPPGGKLWQSRVKQAWLARTPPLKPVMRKWETHGHEQSQYLVIVEAWKQHCQLEGILLANCPMGGVYDHIGAPVAGAGGAAGAAAPADVAPG